MLVQRAGALTAPAAHGVRLRLVRLEIEILDVETCVCLCHLGCLSLLFFFFFSGLDSVISSMWQDALDTHVVERNCCYLCLDLGFVRGPWHDPHLLCLQEVHGQISEMT
jgi:hypothetical protein